MYNLSRKKALVTGAGQGLGMAIAQALLRAGCDLAVHYNRSRDGAAEIRTEAESLGRRCEIYAADLTKMDESQKMVEAATAFLGGLDILVNNAGDLIGRRSLPEIDTEFWQRSFDVNVTSAMSVTQAALPHLSAAKSGASIVNLASLAGRKGGHAGSLAYSTMKGAVITWTRSLSAELGPRGIRVNAVAPGLILGTRFHATHTTRESAEATVRGIPLQRAGNPDDVARAVLFLASEYDGFITGITLDVNGGVFCV